MDPCLLESRLGLRGDEAQRLSQSIGQPLAPSQKRQRGNKVRIQEIVIEEDLEYVEEEEDKIKMLE